MTEQGIISYTMHGSQGQVSSNKLSYRVKFIHWGGYVIEVKIHIKLLTSCDIPKKYGWL